MSTIKRIGTSLQALLWIFVNMSYLIFQASNRHIFYTGKKSGFLFRNPPLVENATIFDLAIFNSHVIAIFLLAPILFFARITFG